MSTQENEESQADSLECSDEAFDHINVSELFESIGDRKPPREIIDQITLKPKPPECALSLFPDILACRAMEVAHDVGCDPVVPLLAGLSAICAVVDARCRLHVTSTWSVPPVLWLMTIGGSSDKKSPGTRPMVSVLNKIQEDDSARYNLEKLLWKAHEARHVSQLKAYQQHHSDINTDLSKVTPPTVSELPPEPKALRLTINDATSQMVIRMAEGRPRGFLMLLDEMENWLKRVNDPRSGDDRGCWIQGYETGAYTADRVTAGTISAENMALAIYGNVQPAVFRAHIEMAATDGLMQRFLPVVVDWEKTVMWEDTPEYMTSKGIFDELCRTLFAMKPTDYYLSPEAKELFRDFSRWYLDLRRSEMLVKSGNVYMTALGKSEGTCLRLALIFQLIQSPESTTVSVKTMGQAINAMKEFFIPSMRYAFVGVAEQGSMLAEWVIEYIIHMSSIKDTIALADLKRAARRKLQGMSSSEADMEIRYIMADLEDAKYIIRIETVGKTIVWAIDPALATLFSDYRKQILIARQRTAEIFKGNANANKK